MVLVAQSPLNLNAVPIFQLPNPADPQKPYLYAFIFWNADGKVTQAANNTIEVPNQDFSITQWYVQTGGDGPAPKRIDTYTFSAEGDNFLSETPIASVQPPAAWTANSSNVDTTNSAVQISARGGIGMESFDRWLILWGAATASNSLLSASKGAYAVAVAAYCVEESKRIPIHPEWELVSVLDRLRKKLVNPGDPGPEDIRRIAEQIRQVAQAEKVATPDEITEIFTRLGEMTTLELRQVATEVKARISRLQAAQRAIEAASKGGK